MEAGASGGQGHFFCEKKRPWTQRKRGYGCLGVYEPIRRFLSCYHGMDPKPAHRGLPGWISENCVALTTGA